MLTKQMQVDNGFIVSELVDGAYSDRKRLIVSCGVDNVQVESIKMSAALDVLK
ncbi:hypothetical protein [Vibrio parahaemolyticus]|uniref:hypothetical protein n=1 Tax=Vibrio parahaemolyticus TaxID=670 RepID=UPI0024935A6D|nr:hypothetical protein [Vibrio parahaemolyticus]